MDRSYIASLVQEVHAGAIDRRMFLARMSALGISTAASLTLLNAVAQTPAASPVASPSVPGEAVTSMTKEEYRPLLQEHFGLEEPSAPGGTIIYGESTDIQTLNPIIVSDSYSSLIVRQVYQYLVQASPIDGLPAPDLADHWIQEADGITYTFHLDPAAMWHDGTPVTADDVVFSFDVTMAEDSPSVRAGTVSQVLDRWEKVDDHTVQLIAKQPFATFLNQTAGLVGIIPKHIWEDVALTQMASDPGSTGQNVSRTVGSGPYQVKEWVVGSHITLTRNPDHWDSGLTNGPDEFIYQIIGEGSSVTQALQTGDIDYCDVEFTDANNLLGVEGVDIQHYDTTSCNWFDMQLNPERTELFTDRRVRQALMWALDRDMMAETIYEGYAVRADGTQPVLSIAYHPDRINTIYTLDPEKSKALLAEAGWEDTDGDGIVEKDGKPFTFVCYYSEGSSIYNQQLPYMQEAWRAVGIDMQPQAIPFPTLSEYGASGEYDMRVRGYTWDPMGSQGTVFRTDSIGAGYNSMHYSNPEYDRLDDLQLRELDFEKRIDLLIEQSNLLNEDVAAGFIVFRQRVTGAQSTLHNFRPNGYNAWWFIPYLWQEA